MLLTGNGGEAGLARCLRLEHIKVKHKSSSGDTEKHGTHTYIPVVVEKVDPVVVGTSDNEGITGFFCEVMSPGKSWLSSQLFYCLEYQQFLLLSIQYLKPIMTA